jgi:hypothetical protein
MPGKALVIDANILVRAVLGRRVREIIETHTEQASFLFPKWRTPKRRSTCRLLSSGAAAIRIAD